MAATTGRHLHAVIADAQVTGRLPSVAAGVVRHGHLVWNGGHGLHVDAERRWAAGPDTAYRIGSITKTFTAVQVMRLRDQGLIDLADTIGRHLRETPFGDTTIRELLNHTGGLPAEPVGPWWERTDGGAWSDLVDAHRDAAPVLPRGGPHHYSNLAYAVLGELIARKNDATWWECVRHQLLEPLGMHATTYAPQAPHADGFSVDPWEGTLVREPHADTGAMAPAGQAWSTVADLARWAAFLATGHADVLDAATLAEMRVPPGARLTGAGAAAGAGGYGLGLRLLDADGRRLAGHTGSMPGFLASLFVDPDRRTGAVVLANATLGLATEQVAPSLLATLEEHEPHVPAPWRPAAAAPPWLREALGVWHWGASPFELTWDGSRALLHRAGSATTARSEFSTYEVIGADRLRGLSGYHHGEELVVRRGSDGAVSHLEVATFVYTRAPYDPSLPDGTIPGGLPG